MAFKSGDYLAIATYNGIDDLNGRFNLMMTHIKPLDIHYSNRLSLIFEKGDSLIKKSGDNMLLLKKKDGNIIRYQAEFYKNCHDD